MIETITIAVLACAAVVFLALWLHAQFALGRARAERRESDEVRREGERMREGVELILKPFRDNLSDFRRRVEDIYSEENRQQGSLRAELRNLMELNQRITQETTNLTSALKGQSKVQGDWGEMILERMLESSNLQKGVHYFVQQTVRSEEGAALRPDVVLTLPEGKRVVIDSKVSLTAYLALSNASRAGSGAGSGAGVVSGAGAGAGVGAGSGAGAGVQNSQNSQDEAARARFAAEHVASVRRHVAELHAKNYQSVVENSPDFVIMFVPSEPAFLAALQADSALWGEAYNKKVIVSSPTNLFALLKIVDDLWKRDNQSKNALEIARQGGALYDKFVGFVSSLEDVGRGLERAQKSYDQALGQLRDGRGNLITSSEKLRELGARASKQLKVES